MRDELAILKARLRRWWYLLTSGMWRGECAINVRDEAGNVIGVASGVSNFVRDSHTLGPFTKVRIWWEKP